MSLVSIFICDSITAQKSDKIELIHADVSEFDQSLNAKATRLIGNVAFKHQNAFMYCDSAYLFRDENRLEAYNNIRITQGDSITLTGKRLNYDGNSKVAHVIDNVIMSDRKMTLNTSQLDYNLESDVASYSDSAHIVDGENVLTSKLGYFFSSTHDLFFRRDVRLVNPKYTMTCDTLRYNTVNKTAFFLGPTQIISKDNIIYCESGWYNTETQKSNFNKNSYLQTKEQRLQGDSVFYDRLKGIGKVFGNVAITDTVNRIIISGDYGEYHELTDSSWVTGQAMMTQIIDGDSLFLHGDTLLAIGENKIDSTNRKKNIFAFHHVKLFKDDLQGSCDSLVYLASDSTIRLYTDPVEVLDSLRFNQIRGKNMVGVLSDNKLYRIDVTGNGQTIYYAKNKNEKNFGVNRADCSDLTIYIEENKVKGISLLNQPDGTLYPIKELSLNELRLKGFSWFDDKRPKTKEDIFRN